MKDARNVLGEMLYL